MTRQVALVNYNTPELTEAAILSVKKHGGSDYLFYVFDNSDCRPFTKKMDGVTIIDNTQGQVIDFNEELAKYPDRSRKMGCVRGGSFGSVKHILSIDRLFDLLPDGFLLVESDVLIRESIDFMFDRNEHTVGHVLSWQRAHNRAKIDRLLPILCWFNVPLLRKNGIRYYDPARAWALSRGNERNRANWYDTGASFLEDIRRNKPQCHGIAIDVRPLLVHYNSASWRGYDVQAHLAWLEQFQEMWKLSDDYTLGDSGHQPPKNGDARLYIAAHGDFSPVVRNPIYEIVDARDGGDSVDGVPGAFYSELLVMQRVAQRKKLPKLVGWCGYRKYFTFFDDVPDLHNIIKKHGCIVSQALDLGMSVREQYDRIVGNVADIDLATEIIADEYPAFLPAWERSLASPLLHPCSMFIMERKQYLNMVSAVWTIVQTYLERIGCSIEERVRTNPGAYKLNRSKVSYQIRVGGQLCERIVSAWIDWNFPQAREWPIKVVTNKIQ